MTHVYLVKVFIYEGHLHIVPQPHTPGELALLPVTTPTLAQGVSLVQDPSVNTVASDSIQDSLKSKLQTYVCVCSSSLAHPSL